MSRLKKTAGEWMRLPAAGLRAFVVDASLHRISATYSGSKRCLTDDQPRGVVPGR
ncbi:MULTISPECIES: hypothetical protein [unclassified Microbulbifer]|uniref:hypothetical protein n=1 Tax=unclassified Microbulbifer TaxID=2619833 RepID=UPI001E548928|nr:hypothetical protein [Microbulbifer sp. YPW16]UHQ55054.1 hypothetical protein LVE68_16320 [Microbulbifer sp. YPW16]